MKNALVARDLRGFTLIEVTLAVGISAIALVGLLAMIPQGVMTMKRATDTAIEARIHQQLVSEIAQTDWQHRGKYDYRAQGGDVRFFDDQGIEIPKSNRDKAIYTVRLALPGADNGGIPISRDLPPRLGSKAAQQFDTSVGARREPLQLVIMEITSAPSVGTVQDFDSQLNWPQIRTYRSTMARLVDTITVDEKR